MLRVFAFLFSPDFSKLEWGTVLTAMGHAFFTLSLGMGAIMIYGSYLPANVSIAKTGFMVAMADTLVALLAGLAIFPIVFANGLDTNSGPGLVFQTLTHRIWANAWRCIFRHFIFCHAGFRSLVFFHFIGSSPR